MTSDVRWKQRFENFEKAVQFFDERYSEYSTDLNNDAYRTAVIQALEVVIELSWKVMNDYLSEMGFDVGGPKPTIREAFKQGLISDPESWLKAIKIRNDTVHRYAAEVADKSIRFIDAKFYDLVRNFRDRLRGEL